MADTDTFACGYQIEGGQQVVPEVVMPEILTEPCTIARPEDVEMLGMRLRVYETH